MKTVIIHGQNHKGSSYNIGRLLANQAAIEEEITEFFLPRDLNHFCLGCYQCLVSDDKCPFYPEKHVIEEAMEAAELLIFTTPTYCLRASAPMKSFIDLTFTHWLSHRPKPHMFHKRAVVISTAAGSGTDSAIKDISTCLFFWGVPYVKKLGYSVQATCWEEVTEKKKREIEKEVNKLAGRIMNSSIPTAGIPIRILFHVFRLYMSNEQMMDTPMATDYLYWKNNGWFLKSRPWDLS